MDQLIQIVKVVLFGIVEGITEWLPISSTGHLILLEEVLQAKDLFLGKEAFWQFFLVAIQLGAILAVIVCFFNKLNPFFGKSLTSSGPKTKEEKKQIWLLWAKVLIACLPAAVIGLLLDDWLDEHLYNSITVSITLIVYGILFIVLEIWNRKRTFQTTEIGALTFKTAFFIGMIQLLSLIPGTSRSGVTILGAMLLLCNREVAAEFSFFLGIPVMFGASLVKLVKFGFDFTVMQAVLLILGMAVSFAVSIVAIKFLMSYIRKNDFKVFGYYRIVLGIVVLLYFGIVSLL